MLSKTEVTNLQKLTSRDDSSLTFMFSALGDPCRLRMFRILAERCNICVTEMAGIMGISIPAASQQLKTLEMSGIVRKERNKQMICYQIRSDNPVVKSLIKLVELKGL